MTLILAWSKPQLGFIACDRLHTDYHTDEGPAPIAHELAPKLKECTDGYYGVAGTLISGTSNNGIPYDIAATADGLTDPNEILAAYGEGYKSVYELVGQLIETHQGEAKAELTMVAGDSVKVLEMNGQVRELLENFFRVEPDLTAGAFSLACS